MRFESILIVTYGRSGSTLLQGVLNTIDGCLIRGENNLFLFDLFKAYNALTKAKNKSQYDTPIDPWFGAHLLDEAVFLSYIKNMTRELLLADKLNSHNTICYGFKEIRYPNIVDDFFEFLDFMAKVFPNVAFIFNTRNLEDVLKSGRWKKENYQETKKKLQILEQLFSDYHATHDNSFHITYADVIHKSPNLIAMFDFLGADYSEQKIDDVLSTPHSYISGPVLCTQRTVRSRGE